MSPLGRTVATSSLRHHPHWKQHVSRNAPRRNKMEPGPNCACHMLFSVQCVQDCCYNGMCASKFASLLALRPVSMEPKNSDEKPIVATELSPLHTRSDARSVMHQNRTWLYFFLGGGKSQLFPISSSNSVQHLFRMPTALNSPWNRPSSFTDIQTNE